MTDTPNASRRYSPEEVAELLRRATTSEGRALPGATEASDGMTLSELGAIGREVGIAPERLALAARELDRDAARESSPLLGAPTLLHTEERVTGALATADVPELLSTIRRVMGQPGTVSEIHGALEWKDIGEGGTRHVSISERDGTTTISASSNLVNVAVLTYLPTGAIGLIGTVIGLGTFFKSGTAFGLAVGVTLLPGMYAAMRQLFKRLSRAEARRLEQVAQELALRIGSGPE